MRSRAAHARALLRIAAGASSAPASSSSAAHHATLSHQAAAAAAASASTSSASPSPLANRSRSFTSRRRMALARQSAASSSRPAPSPSSLFADSFSAAIARSRNYAAHQSSGGPPLASPPPHSLPSVAWESFFSDDRPLLEHETLSGQQTSAKLNLQAAAQEASEALLSVLRSGHDGGASAADFESGSFPLSMLAPLPAWKRRIGRIDAERFGSLLDRLAAASSESKAAAARLVDAEAKRLEQEEQFAEERAEAVAAALERGEDPAAASKLGSEADLIVLGEPEGPQPDWARGVASHLVEKTRAFEAPEPPRVGAGEDKASSAAEIEDDVDNMMIHFEAIVIGEEGDIPSASSSSSSASKSLSDASSSQSSKTTLFVSDDDPNLFLSHAMVQATLPSALAWDRIVAKMDAAATGDSDVARNVVNVSKLDAKLFADDEDAVEERLMMLLGLGGKDGVNVDMDSVRRKRKKKMRKHKYRKLRKATRVERRRKA